MTVVGVAMVRDEADIIVGTVANMLTQVDHVIVADNLSTDDTRPLLERLQASNPRLTVIDDPDPGYRQSAKMTRLAHTAAHVHGADWVVPFDADEWWWSPYGRVADMLESVDPKFLTVTAQLFDHVATGTDMDVADPLVRLGWRRPTPTAMPKVAVRYMPSVEILQGNHDAFYSGRPAPSRGGLLAVHHYPYRSLEQFVRKVRNGAAAYAAAPDVRPDFGAHWRQWGHLLDQDGPDALERIYRTWYYRDDPTVPVCIEGEWQPALTWDPPWQ